MFMQSPQKKGKRRRSVGRTASKVNGEGKFLDPDIGMEEAKGTF